MPITIEMNRKAVLLELIPKESIKGRECKGKRARIER